jgi:hypothetical protein
MTPPPPTQVFLKKHGVKDHLEFGRNDVCDNAAAPATGNCPSFEKLDARGATFVGWMSGWMGRCLLQCQEHRDITMVG